MEIPIYDSAGSRAGTRSLESINRLLAVNLVTVVRKRNGVIVRAMMRQADGAPGVRPSGRMWEPYVHHKILSDGHRAYSHKPLPTNRQLTKKSDLDRYIRGIFNEVQISCMSA